jgi:uncharacterized protein (DUF1697 family)
MPDRYAAFIRGINVGRAKRVPMAELRALVVDFGGTEVSTLLNSGNVVFAIANSSADVLSGAIQEALSTRLGVEARTTVVTAAQFDAVVAQNPLVDVADDRTRLLVAFPADASALEAMESLTAFDWHPEAYAVGPHAAYLWCPGGVADSTLAQTLGAKLGDAVTSRNWPTVLKVQSRLHDE